MRVVIYAPWFLYYSIELANALCLTNSVLLIVRNHTGEVDVGDNSEFIKQKLDSRVKLHVESFHAGSARIFSDVAKLLVVINRYEPDVFHVHDRGDIRTALLFGLLRRTKKVVTIHDVELHPGDSSSKLKEIARSWTRKKADRIICHGSSLKDSFTRVTGISPSKVEVIHHGVLSHYHHNETFHIDQGNTILFFGRAVRYKGLDVLIQAVPYIKCKVDNIKVVIAGRGPDMSRCLSMIREPSDFEVHNEFIPNEKVAELFSRSKAVIVPYIEASQSGVIAVAYSFNKPVVATYTGSLHEVVVDGVTGKLCKPRDPVELANAIVDVLTNLQTAETTQAIQNFVNENLAWDKIAEKTVTAYLA